MRFRSRVAWARHLLLPFDRCDEVWSISWFDGRFPASLDPPVRGRFEDGVGTFFANDIFNGAPIKVRFVWDSRDRNAPRWEQAFSNDDGISWETNWVMIFHEAK